MIELLCLAAAVTCGLVGVTLWTCMLLARAADMQMDEGFRAQPFFAGEA